MKVMPDTRKPDDRFSIEESAALLHYIMPEYPEKTWTRPVPNLEQFLRKLREEQHA